MTGRGIWEVSAKDLLIFRGDSGGQQFTEFTNKLIYAQAYVKWKASTTLQENF